MAEAYLGWGEAEEVRIHDTCCHERKGRYIIFSGASCSPCAKERRAHSTNPDAIGTARNTRTRTKRKSYTHQKKKKTHLPTDSLPMPAPPALGPPQRVGGERIGVAKACVHDRLGVPQRCGSHKFTCVVGLNQSTWHLGGRADRTLQVTSDIFLVQCRGNLQARSSCMKDVSFEFNPCLAKIFFFFFHPSVGW